VGRVADVHRRVVASAGFARGGHLGNINPPAVGDVAVVGREGIGECDLLQTGALGGHGLCRGSCDERREDKEKGPHIRSCHTKSETYTLFLTRRLARSNSIQQRRWLRFTA